MPGELLFGNSGKAKGRILELWTMDSSIIDKQRNNEYIMPVVDKGM